MNDLAVTRPIASRARTRTMLDLIRSAAAAHGVGCEAFGDDAQLVRLRRGDRVRLVYPDGGCNESHVSVAIARDADLTHKFLAEAGIPVPNVLAATHADEAARAAILWSGPVAIVPLGMKDRVGSLARFDNPDQIRAAFMRRSLLSRGAAVLGPLHGCDHRVLVVGGAAVAAARCTPPYVMGDGASTIQRLIAVANAESAGRRGAIPCDGLTELVLARQGLTLDSRARAGQVVHLREGCDHNAGGAVEDVTASMDREVARECGRAARQIGLDVAEVSVVCEDISLPLPAQRGCIVAVDPSPDIGIYLSPAGDDVHDIGRALMQLLFPEAQA